MEAHEAAMKAEEERATLQEDEELALTYDMQEPVDAGLGVHESEVRRSARRTPRRAGETTVKMDSTPKTAAKKEPKLTAKKRKKTVTFESTPEESDTSSDEQWEQDEDDDWVAVPKARVVAKVLAKGKLSKHPAVPVRSAKVRVMTAPRIVSHKRLPSGVASPSKKQSPQTQVPSSSTASSRVTTLMCPSSGRQLLRVPVRAGGLGEYEKPRWTPSRGSSKRTAQDRQ